MHAAFWQLPSSKCFPTCCFVLASQHSGSGGDIASSIFKDGGILGFERSNNVPKVTYPDTGSSGSEVSSWLQSQCPLWLCIPVHNQGHVHFQLCFVLVYVVQMPFCYNALYVPWPILHFAKACITFIALIGQTRVDHFKSEQTGIQNITHKGVLQQIKDFAL